MTALIGDRIIDASDNSTFHAAGRFYLRALKSYEDNCDGEVVGRIKNRTPASWLAKVSEWPSGEQIDGSIYPDGRISLRSQMACRPAISIDILSVVQGQAKES
ncbi:hypothetical protein ACFVS2_07940 [Brevibacillus sp. NPDC058079]|uniref:hypothetical protein n=1 Tax=Brevibacillus sp. NPDC058079 TaxID=3346330 RepID=UPI0036E8858C